MISKWLVLFGYATAAALMFIYRNPVLDWMKSGETSGTAFVFAAAVLLATVPIVPYGMIGAVIGYKYGPLLGGMMNVGSSTIAAVVMFYLIRYVFQERGRLLISRIRSLDRFTHLVERNAFLAVLMARLIPVMPAPAVNGYAAISRMGFISYFMGTVIGKVPVMFMFAFVGDRLLEDVSTTLWVVGFYIMFLALIYAVYRKAPKAL